MCSELAPDERKEIPDAADDALAQEDDQQYEHHAQHQFPLRAQPQRRLQEILQEQPHGGADQRAEQRGAAADGGLHHELAGGVEHEGIRRHESLQHAKQTPCQTGVGSSNDERGKFVTLDVMPHSGRTQRIFTDRGEDRADRRAHDAQCDHDPDEVKERDERIERPAAGEMDGLEAEIDGRGRNTGQTVLAAGPCRQGIKLDEVEYLGDRNRDHRKIDAGAAQREQPDQIADKGGRDHPDEQRKHDIRKTRLGEQIGGDETTGTVEGRLTE